MQYPLFEQALKNNVVQDAMRQNQGSTFGVVVSYFSDTNTANIVCAQPGTEYPGERYEDVPCPTHYGVQMLDPEPGTMCYVSFRDGGKSMPYITHFFSHDNALYERQYKVDTGIPHYLMEM